MKFSSNKDEMLLLEAFEFVGMGELERDDHWEEMRIWHRAVAKRFDLEPEPWADVRMPRDP